MRIKKETKNLLFKKPKTGFNIIGWELWRLERNIRQFLTQKYTCRVCGKKINKPKKDNILGDICIKCAFDGFPKNFVMENFKGNEKNNYGR